MVVSRRLIAVAAVGALALAGCGGGGKKKTHHTPTVAGAEKAQRDILDRALKRSHKKDTVKSVTCVKATAARTFTCSVTLSNGRRSRTQVLYAASGNVRSHKLQ